MLVTGSPLSDHVGDGLRAMQKAHRKHVADDIREEFDDSLDVDDAFQAKHSAENRWDYLLGHGPTGHVVALEPHSATEGEISTVIRKRAQARLQLAAHQRDGRDVERWYWVASGKVGFPRLDRAVLRCAQAGITFVGPVLRKKDLPPARGSARKKR